MTTSEHKTELILHLKNKHIEDIDELWSQSKDFYSRKLEEMGGCYTSFGKDISVHLYREGVHHRFLVYLNELQ